MEDGRWRWKMVTKNGRRLASRPPRVVSTQGSITIQSPQPKPKAKARRLSRSQAHQLTRRHPMTDAQAGRVTVDFDVVFGTGGGRDLKCNVYMPPQQGSDRPSILLVHGGGWTTGDRSQLHG